MHAAGVASGRELDEAEANFAGSQADQARATAFAKAYGNGQHVDQRLPLRAPIDGVLVERRMSPGMAVSPDSERPLAVIGDPDRLWLQLDVPEGLAGRLKAGMQVSVPGADGQPLQATLQHVDDFVDSERRVVQARAELDNRARGFKAAVRARPGGVAGRGRCLAARCGRVVDRRQAGGVRSEGKGRFVRHAVHADELGDGRLWVREAHAGARVVVDACCCSSWRTAHRSPPAPARGTPPMIDRLIAYRLRQPLMVMLALLLFMGAGIAAFRVLPVEAFPDVSDTQVTVVSLHPGRAAEEVEREVTMPLEVALSGIPHSVRVFSHTQFGLSMIILTFDDKADDYFARQQVLERLQGVELPEGVTPELEAMSSVGEIYRYVLKGPHLTPTQLRTVQEWTMERSLRTVPGVADVISFGGFARTFQVKPDLDKLRDRGISLGEFAEALEKGSSNAGGGYVERGQQQFLIRGVGLMRSPADIGNVVVAQRSGTPILVRDLAGIADTGLHPQGLVGQDDNDDAVFGMVLMRKGENPSDVLDALHARIAEIEANQLPAGVSIEPFYDRSWLVSTTLKTVFSNLLEGAVLVFLVLWLFLYNARAALIVAAMMPLALLSTFLGLHLWGVPANLLSLGAMDFGIIIDGAVIVTEHIVSRLSKLPPAADRKTRFSTILSAASEVGTDVLLDADHHRRAYPDFHPAAPGGPHVRADGVLGDLGIDRRADPGAGRGAVVLLLVAAARPHARRQSADGPPDRLVPAGPERALARPRGGTDRSRAAGGHAGAGHPPGIGVPARAGRRLDLADRHARPQHQPGRSAAAVAAHPRTGRHVPAGIDGGGQAGTPGRRLRCQGRQPDRGAGGVEAGEGMAEKRGQATAGERPAAHAGAAHSGPRVSISQPVRDNILESISQIKGQVDQGQRLGSGRVEPAGAGDPRAGTRRGGRGERLHRPRRLVAAAADRD